MIISLNLALLPTMLILGEICLIHLTGPHLVPCLVAYQVGRHYPLIELLLSWPGIEINAQDDQVALSYDQS